VSSSNQSGACPEIARLVSNHAQDHLLTPVSGKIRAIDISAAFRSGRAKNDDPKVVEHYRQGIAISALRENPALFPQALEVLQEAERMVLKEWHSHKREEKLLQLHHTSAPKLNGLWTPQISRRTDLKPTPLALEAAQYLSETPFKVKDDLNDLFWQVRSMIPLGETDDNRFSKQESFYPMRLRHMSLATDGNEFFIAMGVFCWALRMYAKSAGTLHPMFDNASRAMVQLGYEIPIDHTNWMFFRSWCKRHFAKKETLKAWCVRCLKDPKRALLAGAMGESGGCGRYEFAACQEFARLERMPARDRRSSFMVELDTEGSGPKLINLVYGTVRKLNEIDVVAVGYIHPREELYAQILVEQLPILSSAPKVAVIAILRAIFSPKTYGSGAGPVYDVLAGMKGMRDGFSSTEELIDMPRFLRNKLVHLHPAQAHQSLKSLSKMLSEAFNTAFPHIAKANRRSINRWKELRWQDRSIGKGLYMSPFRISDDADGDISSTENPETTSVSDWRVRASYTHPVLKTLKDVSCSVDVGKMDTKGTSHEGRKIHRIDAEHRSRCALHCRDRGVSIYSIHDAAAPGIGMISQYLDCDSQALIDMFPKQCKKIGFTTSSRICN